MLSPRAQPERGRSFLALVVTPLSPERDGALSFLAESVRYPGGMIVPLAFNVEKLGGTHCDHRIWRLPFYANSVFFAKPRTVAKLKAFAAFHARPKGDQQTSTFSSDVTAAN